VRVADLSVGDTNTVVVLENLTRTQIVMYAGASGDFNPLHTDELYATDVAGYPTVIAHGQLTMGVSAKAVTDWVDEAEIAAYGVRFRERVWPGDTLTTVATVDAVSSGGSGAAAEIAIMTVNQDGLEVLTGYMRIRDL
jgi:acyl dehydratase